MPSIQIRLSLWIAIALLSLGRAQAADRTEQGVNYLPIRPSATDPAIKDFDDPSWVYAQLDILTAHNPQLPADRHELLLWIPGTKPPNTPAPEAGHVARGASHTFCLTAASLGYHVIALSYPNTISASSCDGDAEPAAFEEFRMAVISGGTTKHITVSRTDCIENRLIKLLQMLATRRPAEDWGQFLNKDGTIKWDAIAVAGQSQGGGHAALIGIHHRVTRVLCFGAPKDYSTALQAPAAWYAKSSATPKEAYFAFNHQQDRQGCTPEHQLDNLRALKLDAFGPPVLVENASAPYQNAHMLMTNYPDTKVDSHTAHGTMINPQNSQLFAGVWRYMLTK